MSWESKFLSEYKKLKGAQRAEFVKFLLQLIDILEQDAERANAALKSPEKLAAAFFSLTENQQAAFYERCVVAKPPSLFYKQTMAWVEFGKSLANFYNKKLGPFDRKQKRHMAPRDALVARLLEAGGMTNGQIRINPAVKALNNGKPMTKDQFKGVQRRIRKKNAVSKNNGVASN